MARRQMNVFSLSFLDVMSCGFGAVVLIFLIINHATDDEKEVINDDLLAEIRMLDYQVLQGEKDLFDLLENLDATEQRLADADKQLNATRDRLDISKEDLDELKKVSLAEIESLESLKSDVETREEELERLKANQDANDGSRVLAIEGEGNRQYLTGLRVGGEYLVIAVDMSASMLDDTIINVLRRRNMSDERKRKAAKWQRAVRTVDWLAAQLPLDAKFQVLAFNTEVTSLVDDSGSVDMLAWEPVGDGRTLRKALERSRDLVPSGGTNLHNLANAISSLSPLPDNVYLIVDSLPTQGDRAPRAATISGRDRLDLFRAARTRLPQQVPMNIIMFPMEGDPFAAAAYWHWARASGGAYMAPSRDWP